MLWRFTGRKYERGNWWFYYSDTECFRLAADTLRELQRGERIVPRRLRTRVPTLARRLGEAIEPRTLDRDGDDLGILAMRELLSGRDEDKALGAGRLAAQTNAVAVLGMIKNLQNEIQVK